MLKFIGLHVHAYFQTTTEELSVSRLMCWPPPPGAVSRFFDPSVAYKSSDLLTLKYLPLFTSMTVDLWPYLDTV